MNIQFQNEQQLTLVGSIRSQGSFLDKNSMIALKQINKDQQPPKEIVHKIVYGDTLQGLSLTYDVPIFNIKQRNKLQSDAIYYLREIVIPNPRVVQTPTKQQNEFMKIQQFVMYMSAAQKSTKTARYYLSESNWDVEKAVEQYRKDLQWEKKNKLTSVPLGKYNPIELVTKKRS